MAYIRYVNNPNGMVYASVVDGVRTGNTVKQKYIANLGRVIDREKGIYKSRERGVYQYFLETGYCEVESELVPSEVTVSEKEKLILDFGDSFLLYKYMQTLPLYGVYRNVTPFNNYTLLSLLFYRILADKKAYCYADTWWSGNYASILFPLARLQSQRVSEFLMTLGKKEVQRRFFADYLSSIYGKHGGTCHSSKVAERYTFQKKKERQG